MEAAPAGAGRLERGVRLPALTPAQQKAMRHILANGDDLALKGKQWQATKVELYRMGLLRRRIGDWAWIPTEAAKQPNVGAKLETTAAPK